MTGEWGMQGMWWTWPLIVLVISIIYGACIGGIVLIRKNYFSKRTILKGAIYGLVGGLMLATAVHLKISMDIGLIS